MAKPTNNNSMPKGQSALWTFLFYTLVGPFVASVLVVLALVLAPPFGLGALLPAVSTSVGETAIATYLWAAVPSAIAALVLLPFVLLRGTFGWLEAAVAGVLGFSVALFVSPAPVGTAVPFFAFVAGVVSLGVRQILVAGKIIES